MAKGLIYIALLLVIVSQTPLSYAESSQAQDTNIDKKAALLQEYFSKSFDNPEAIKYRRLFFETFPNSFSELEAIYGYDDVIGAAPLYDGSEHILELFNILECIDEKTYYVKLINIAIGGHWNADAVNYFQHGLHNRVLKKPELTFELLSPMSDSDIRSFFFFFFHAIHPRFKEIPAELAALQSSNPRVFNLMVEGFNEAIKQSGH